jgi:hypothetical protein
MAGILDFIDQKLGTRLGLLMSDPRAAIEQMNQQAGAYNQASLLATQAERNALRGLPVTPEQAAAKQYVDKSLEDVAMGFAGTTIGKPMKVYRAGAEEGMTAKSGGPTFYSLEETGAKPFESYGKTKEYNISPNKIIDASRGEGIKIYRDFLKETNSPAGYGKTGRPYWTAEYDFRNWLKEKKIPFDAIMFDEPTGIASIAIYK